MNKYEIVKRLEYCIENKCDICQEENGSGFPWIDGRCYGFTERLYDVITLLKAQEPALIDLQTINNKVKYGYCPKCNQILDGIYNKQFCGRCGQAVKWDG